MKLSKITLSTSILLLVGCGGSETESNETEKPSSELVVIEVTSTPIVITPAPVVIIPTPVVTSTPSPTTPPVPIIVPTVVPTEKPTPPPEPTPIPEPAGVTSTITSDLVVPQFDGSQQAVLDMTEFKNQNIDYFGGVDEPLRTILTKGIELSNNYLSLADSDVTTGKIFSSYGSIMQWRELEGTPPNFYDIAYGNAVYSIYNTYCELAELERFCLGDELDLSMHTWDEGGVRQYSYAFNGHRFITSSRRELQLHLLQGLIEDYGREGIPTSVEDALAKKYIALDFDLYGDITTFNDPIWLGELFMWLNTKLESKVSYTLGKVTVRDYPGLDELDLAPLLNAVYGKGHYGSYGRVSANITTHKDSNDFWGWSYLRWSQSPYFTMSETGNWTVADKYETNSFDQLSRIILHEIGHNLNLGHNDFVESYFKSTSTKYDLWISYYEAMTSVPRY